MKRPIRPFTPIIVTWEDASADSQAQHEDCASALRSYQPELRLTIGFFAGIATCGKYRAVMIALHDDRQCSGGQEHLGGLFQIPVRMVLRIQQLETKKRRRA